MDMHSHKSAGLRLRWGVLTVMSLLAAGIFLRLAMPLEPEQPPPSPVVFKDIRWADLRPRTWDPMKRFQQFQPDALEDSDPRAQHLLADILAAWDSAPTVAAMDGAAVRLAGYLVPLDGEHDALREFLLVPHFGECIHSPPPAANQIVHVVAGSPLRGFQAMDTVWVSGVLHTVRQASSMGTSGYTMAASGIERYVPPP